MEKSLFSFNVLEKCRYDVTAGHNGKYQGIQQYSVAASTTTWMLEMNIFYTELLAELEKYFGCTSPDVTASASQQLRNHRSTLNGFLSSVGKSTDARVGVELASGFDDSVRHYLSIINVAPRTQRDRKGHLHLIHRLYVDMKKRRTGGEKPSTDLSVELRSAISKTGLAPKTLAKNVGVSPSALRRWLHGAMPNQRGIPGLRRVESALGLTRDSLVHLVHEDDTVSRASVQTIAFRERLATLRENALMLSEDELTRAFLTEWRQLFDYKTTGFPLLERHPRGVWRCIPAESSAVLSSLATKGKLVCPTANITLQIVRSFLGVLQGLPTGNGGLCEWDGTFSQTLAWLAHPRALSIYLEWLTQRSGGIQHGRHQVFCSTVAALVRPGTGFLWQQPEFGLKLPGQFLVTHPENWKVICEQSHKLLRSYIKNATGVSRDPEQPIESLLNQPNALAPILKAIERIEQDAAAAIPGSVREATLRRDALLLGMLLSNPLRQRVYMCMTWLPNGSGTLRGSSQSGWRIRLDSHHLKNGNSADARGYDVRVADWLKPRLDAYIEEYRNTILGGKACPYLFVSSRSSGIWQGLKKHITVLTRRYIDNCPGFGSHAFRHLVATAWLCEHPHDYLTVAELLNDKLSTVIENYAHLKRDHSFSRYESHVEKLL